MRVEDSYKSSDLYNIGREATGDRKGTGNVDKVRTIYNYEYVSLNEINLYQEVKKRLSTRKIEYANKKNTNMMNGIVFTSGVEFFEALGMKFINTDKTYKTGDKKGQFVKIPDIKSKDDIPQTVTYFFDCCMEYLKELVGEENILIASVHYDEDTPHLQTYFLPVVNKVLRRVFEKDKDGNVIKVKTINKNGKEILVPKMKKNDKGKNIYEEFNGLFLNSDQFWKQKGGKNSYHNLHNSFHDFITEKGFKLDRGKIGSTVEHKTKLEWQIEENKAELEELKHQKDYVTKEIKNSKTTLIKANDDINNNVLNPKYNKVLGFNKNDVEELRIYSSNITKINNIQKDEIMSKDELINELTNQINTYKQNDELKIRNEKIKEQQGIISKLTDEITNFKEVVNI